MNAKVNGDREAADLSTRYFTNTFGMLLDILFATTAGMTGANKLCVFLEARRIGLATMSVALRGDNE